MRPVHLRLEGFGSYLKPCELELGNVEDCVVLGRNGAGKSTLFRAMLWAMYGETGDVKADEVVHPEAETAVVEYTFVDKQGRRHTFTRTRTTKGAGKATAHWSGPGGTLEKAREVAEMAESVLNCDVGLLTLTAIARQGEVGAFAAMSTADRRERLSSVILGSVFDGCYEIASESQAGASTAEAEASSRLNETRRVAEGLAEAEANEVALGEKVAEAEKERDRIAGLILASSPESVKAAEKVLSRLADATGELAQAKKGLEEAKAKVEGAQAAAEQSKASVAESAPTLAKAESEAEKAAQTAKTAEGDSRKASQVAAEAEGRAHGMESRLEGLSTEGRGEPECWTCGQPLTDEQRNALVEEAQQLIEAAKNTRNAASSAKRAETQAAEAAEDAAASVETAKRQMAEQETRITQHQQLAETESARVGQMEDTIGKLEGALSTLEAEAAEARTIIKSAEGSPTQADQKRAETALQEAIRAHAEAQFMVKRCREADSELGGLENVKLAAASRARVAALAKDAFRPSGVPHTALRSRLDDFQTACNDSLAHLGGLRMEISAPLSEKRQQDLSILGSRWDRGDGGMRRYEAMSGGERMRLDLALRVGLCRVSGVQSGTLLLDEGWGALDSDGTASLAHMLRNLIDTGEMESIYTITHVEGAADAFSHRIIVDRKSDGSSYATVE